MLELQNLAEKLLRDSTVRVVIGYEEGPRGVRPAFIKDPNDAKRLIFDHRCVHNLATYLSPRRSQIKAMGKPAVVVKPCDARAVAGLIRESQLDRSDVMLIGVRCGGVVKSAVVAGKLDAANLADRCVECSTLEPKLFDHLVGQASPPPAAEPRRDRQIEELDQKSPEERWSFWEQELGRCVRCHACRQVCPMCFCERCLAEKTQPVWVESSPHGRANLMFHMSRALHLAGRCVDCGECERACPAHIPLNLISRKLIKVMAERFDHDLTDDPEAPAPIGTYRLDDGQEFII